MRHELNGAGACHPGTASVSPADLDRLPGYDELLAQTDAPPGAAWRVFGHGDRLGTLNFLTPERIAHAATLVRTGRRFGLDYPVNAFEPFPSGARPAAAHHVFTNNPHHRDDYLDGFYLQATSQIDSLRHIGHPVHGFYGGVQAAEPGAADARLGIHSVAASGIAARGVLLDVERFLAERGTPLRPDVGTKISAATLRATAEAQGVTVELGDVLLIRTGWASHYLGLDRDGRTRLSRSPAMPGLAQQHDLVRWLWRHQVAMIATDNLAVEALPVVDSDFTLPGQPPPERGYDHNGWLHRPLIALLGMVLGELWALDELAAACAETGVYDFLLVSKPLLLVGGVGSPANAVALM